MGEESKLDTIYALAKKPYEQAQFDALSDEQKQLVEKGERQLIAAFIVSAATLHSLRSPIQSEVHRPYENRITIPRMQLQALCKIYAETHLADDDSHANTMADKLIPEIIDASLKSKVFSYAQRSENKGDRSK